MPIDVVLLLFLPLLVFASRKFIRLLASDGDSTIAYPLSAKVVYRGVGALNIALCILGAYWMMTTIHNVVKRQHVDPETKYYLAAFITLNLLSVVLMIALVITAIKLINLTRNAVRSYCVLVVVFFVCELLTAGLWSAPDPVGMSIAAASGTGEMGIAAFVFLIPFPYVYPILTALILSAFNWRLARLKLQTA
jgi:hypothetical protein